MLVDFRRPKLEMSGQDTVVLRRVFALDSNCSAALSANQVLVTTGNAGTVWMNVLSSLNAAGGSVIGNLPSTIQTLSTGIYSNTSTFTEYFSTLDFQVCTISTLVDGFVQNGVSPPQLFSTVDGLGSIGYISSQQLLSTTTGLLHNLAALGFVSTLTLDSTVIGLGSLGYISSQQLTSTVRGLGSIGYISSQSLNSTVIGLGTAGYVSSQSLASTTQDLTNFISNVSVSKTSIRFDQTGTVQIYGGNNTVNFSNVGTLIYLSTFFFSSLAVTGNNGIQFNGQVSNYHVLTFSSISFDLSPFDPYMVSSSLVTLDFYPQIAFTKLATGANAPAMLLMSTFLTNGANNLLNTTVNNYFLASQTVFVQSGPLYYDTSNVFNSPIRMTVNASSIVGRTSNPFTLNHVLPSSINNGGFQNALHTSTVTPYFGNPGGLFVSIQNIP